MHLTLDKYGRVFLDSFAFFSQIIAHVVAFLNPAEVTYHQLERFAHDMNVRNIEPLRHVKLGEDTFRLRLIRAETHLHGIVHGSIDFVKRLGKQHPPSLVHGGLKVGVPIIPRRLWLAVAVPVMSQNIGFFHVVDLRIHRLTHRHDLVVVLPQRGEGVELTFVGNFIRIHGFRLFCLFFCLLLSRRHPIGINRGTKPSLQLFAHRFRLLRLEQGH